MIWSDTFILLSDDAYVWLTQFPCSYITGSWKCFVYNIRNMQVRLFYYYVRYGGAKPSNPQLGFGLLAPANALCQWPLSCTAGNHHAPLAAGICYQNWSWILCLKHLLLLYVISCTTSNNLYQLSMIMKNMGFHGENLEVCNKFS